VSVIDLPFSSNGYYGIAVAPDQSIFATAFVGPNRAQVRKFSQSGDLLKSLTITSVYNVGDIDIADDGTIALGTPDGKIVTTDTLLNGFETYNATIFNDDGNVFVTFVPEPGSASLILTGACFITCRRRRQ
jgi:hypothetical protein